MQGLCKWFVLLFLYAVGLVAGTGYAYGRLGLPGCPEWLKESDWQGGFYSEDVLERLKESDWQGGFYSEGGLEWLKESDWQGGFYSEDVLERLKESDWQGGFYSEGGLEWLKESDWHGGFYSEGGLERLKESDWQGRLYSEGGLEWLKESDWQGGLDGRERLDASDGYDGFEGMGQWDHDRIDTIIDISGVAVRASRWFLPETAGMTESYVDSIVFAGKATLSLSDLLSENTPVFIRQHGRGALATASFRGTAASHTQVKWNGIPVNSPMTGMVDFSQIPVYLIDDISLRHGTASIADGSGGLGGSILLGNRANWGQRLHVSALQGVGSYGTSDSFLTLGGGGERWQLASRLYRNVSENDFPFLNRGIATVVDGRLVHPIDTNRNADYGRSGFLQELYFLPDNKQSVSLKWWSQWSGRSIPQATSYEGPEHSNLNRQNDTDHRAVAEWNRFSEAGSWVLRSGFSHKHLHYSLLNHIPSLGTIPAIYSEGNQISLFQHAGWSHHVTERVALRATMDANTHRIETADTVSGSGYRERRSEYSMLLSGQLRATQRLHLQLMLRQELVDGDLQPLVPFAGLDFLLFPDAGVLFKANVARNHHHPTMNDLYWIPGGNPDLLPEKGFSMEAGLQLGDRSWRDIRFGAEVTAFRADTEDWIIWIPSFRGYWEPRNISRVLTKGFEASVQANGIFYGVEAAVLANYAFTRSINDGDPLVWGDHSRGKQLPFIPVHSGNVFVRFGYRGFHLGWQHNSCSERFTTSSNDTSKRNWLYPYFMNDIVFGKVVANNKRSISANVKIYNLFNETYHSILYRPMPGRHFMVTVRLQITGER